MAFTDSKYHPENDENHHGVTKSPRRQRGGSPLSTITGNLDHVSSEEHSMRYKSIFAIDSEDDGDENHQFQDLDEVDRMLPGVLAEGIAYTVKETIAQGYIGKKGSGLDWIGSRAWKTRWAVLVKARTDGHDVDVPLLQIYWDYHSPSPSTVISLDSAVVLPENDFDPTKADCKRPYKFQIRHVKQSKHSGMEELQLTRILSCVEEEERDRWVYRINEALLQYEKEKAASKAARKMSSISMSPPRGQYRAWAIQEDVMPMTNSQRKSLSPPRIPLRNQFLR